MEIRNLWVIWALAPVLSCLSTSCSREQHHDFTKHQPVETDVAGSYFPDAATGTLTQEKMGPVRITSRLVLHADHTATLQNLPDWRNAAALPQTGKLVNFSGTWKIEKNAGGYWAVSVQYQAEQASKTEAFPLTRQRPPYLLRIPLGSPDATEALIYEKQF